MLIIQSWKHGILQGSLPKLLIASRQSLNLEGKILFRSVLDPSVSDSTLASSLTRLSMCYSTPRLSTDLFAKYSHQCVASFHGTVTHFPSCLPTIIRNHRHLQKPRLSTKTGLLNMSMSRRFVIILQYKSFSNHTINTEY